jgi:hypothetical protein
MRAFLGDFEEVIFCECFGQGLFVEASGDLNQLSMACISAEILIVAKLEKVSETA